MRSGRARDGQSRGTGVVSRGPVSVTRPWTLGSGTLVRFLCPRGPRVGGQGGYLDSGTNDTHHRRCPWNQDDRRLRVPVFQKWLCTRHA